MLATAAHGSSAPPPTAPPPTAPTPAVTAAATVHALPPVTTPAPPTIRHRLHASGPPIGGPAGGPTGGGATAVSSSTAWPSPTAPATPAAPAAPAAAVATVRPATATGGPPTTKAPAVQSGSAAAANRTRMPLTAKPWPTPVATTTTRIPMLPKPAGWPNSGGAGRTAAAAAAAARKAPLAPTSTSATATASASSGGRRPTAKPETPASQAERPHAADATVLPPGPPPGPPPDPARAPASDSVSTLTDTAADDADTDTATVRVRASDDGEYPMYAEYPDGAANMTSNNAGESTDGDVVPDPDALRQDADEAEERERASLAADPDPRGMQFIGQATGVVAVADEVLPSGTNVDVVMDPVAGDIRVAGGVARVGAAAGRMLDAGFEHSAVVEGGAGRDALLDLPVDPDLRERDRLDGDVYRDRERAELQLHHQGAAGKQVVVVGAALALVAQFLCMASAARRLRPGHRVDVSTAVLFNVELALVFESLVFMLGVQAVGDPLRCAWVALALHYLHLVAAGWFLANVGYIVYRLRVGRLPAYFRPVAFTVWVCPAVLVSAMYIAQPRSYETHRYCWMAVQRGLLLTFVAPVAVLVMINAGLTMRGLCAVSRRRQRQPDEAEAVKGLVTAAAAAEQEALEGGGGGVGGALVPEDERDACTAAELRSSLRAAAAMLPLYSADWFLGVVAMDNSTFMTYPLCFLVSNGFLNWFLMVCAWLIVPRESNKEGGDFCGGGDGDDLDDEEEMLLEEEEAGCWGKPSSPSASLLDNAYGTAFGAAFDERAACAALWAAGDVPSHGPITAEPHASADGSAAAAAAPRWEGADYYMTDVDLGSGGGGHLQRPEAAAGVPSAVIQELAEMRYDGGISTITT